VLRSLREIFAPPRRALRVVAATENISNIFSHLTPLIQGLFWISVCLKVTYRSSGPRHADIVKGSKKDSRRQNGNCNIYLLDNDSRIFVSSNTLTLPLATDLLSLGFIMYLLAQVSAAESRKLVPWKLAEQLHTINGRSSIYFCSLTLVDISSSERIEGFIVM
jgi:hypothetical protein